MDETKTTRDGHVVETRHSSTPAWLIGLLFIVAIVVAAFAFGLVNIDQVREAQAPTVKLETSGGQAPVFDIETARVSIGSKPATVETPTVSVGSTSTTVEVPTISVDPAGNPNARDK